MSQNDPLREALEQVNDAETFLFFVHALVFDLEDENRKEKISPSPPYGPEANGWENGTIENYLDAAASAVEDGKYFAKAAAEGVNQWRQFAEFLYRGKIYE